VRSVKLFLNADWLEQHERQLLAILIALATCIIVRNVVAHLNGEAFSRLDGTWTIAQNLVNGKGYSACDRSYFPLCGPDNQTTAMRMPTTVLLMAAAMMFSTSHVAGVVVQGLMYLGTLWIIYASLKEYDRRVALLAALLWVISIPVIHNIDHDGGDMAAAFFFSAGLFFFQRGRQKSGLLHWLLAGALLGIASQASAVLLGVSGGLIIGLLWERRKRIRQGLLEFAGPALVCFAAFGAVLAPWVVRNEVVFGTPAVSGTLVGYNVYRMNYILQSDRVAPHYVGPDEAFQAIHDLIQNGNLRGNENEAEMQAFYYDSGLRIIRSHLIGYFLLSLYRFLPLWFNVGVNAAYGNRFGLLDALAVVEQVFLLIAGLTGAFLYRKQFWPLILSVVVACGAYMAVDAQLRYLTDVMPAIVILAASIMPLADRYMNRIAK
jgi:hypothetical protein